MSTIATLIPKVVFVVPYRNRPQHKFFFSNYLTSVLKGSLNYEIYFSHQCDARAFNRGATKNIGFLAVKQKYPDDYQNITFVFNDIDTVPFSNIFDYITCSGIVKHFYGFKYALGGIVALTGRDFELINGYPNFWGWGMEDNVLQKRCESAGLIINRDQFYPIGSPDILQLFDGVSRLINKKDPWRMKNDDGIDGIKTIHNLYYSLDKNSKNSKDNVYVVDNPRMYVVNVTNFLTRVKFEGDDYYKYDLREPSRKIVHPDKIKKMTHTVMPTEEDWRNIPQTQYTAPEPRIEMENNIYRQGNNKQSDASILYSPNYAKNNGIQSRATTKSVIRLGGLR